MAQEEKRKWKVSDIWTILKNGLGAIVKGDFLLRVNAGKYFIHIAYTFILLGIIILQSLMVETALGKVERNKETIHNLEIAQSDKTFELAAVSKRGSVRERLLDLGSKVTEPENSATELE